MFKCRQEWNLNLSYQSSLSGEQHQLSEQHDHEPHRRSSRREGGVLRTRRQTNDTPVLGCGHAKRQWLPPLRLIVGKLGGLRRGSSLWICPSSHRSVLGMIGGSWITALQIASAGPCGNRRALVVAAFAVVVFLSMGGWKGPDGSGYQPRWNTHTTSEGPTGTASSTTTGTARETRRSVTSLQQKKSLTLGLLASYWDVQYFEGRPRPRRTGLGLAEPLLNLAIYPESPPSPSPATVADLALAFLSQALRCHLCSLESSSSDKRVPSRQLRLDNSWAGRVRP